MKMVRDANGHRPVCRLVSAPPGKDNGGDVSSDAINLEPHGLELLELLPDLVSWSNFGGDGCIRRFNGFDIMWVELK